MLEFRSAPTEPVLKLTWDEFEQMVRRDQVAPTDLVRARVITGDDWWTADNLSVFHRNSRAKHPLGEHLAAEVETKKRRNRDDWAWQTVLFHYEMVRQFEDGHRLMPLPLIVAEQGVVAASRFITRPSFRPDRIVTCVYTQSELRVEALTPSIAGWRPQMSGKLASDGTWETCPKFDFRPVGSRGATTVIEPKRAPWLLRSARAVVAAAKRAPPCHTDTLDGVGYDHLVMTPRTMFYAHWSNPRGEEHAAQLALVDAYQSLLAMTELAEIKA